MPLFPLGILLVTARGPAVIAPTWAEVSVLPQAPGLRLPFVAAGEVVELPCCGSMVMGPEDAAAWDGLPCDDPDRPGCCTCPSLTYRQRFTMAPGSTLLFPEGAAAVTVVLAFPSRLPVDCLSPCTEQGDNGYELQDPSPVPSAWSLVWSGPADYDADGDIGTDADIEAFFACLAGRCCRTCTPDFNLDGDAGTDADVAAFFRALAGER